MSEKVDKRYWESLWQPMALPRGIFPEQDTLRNHSYHHMHRYFEEIIRPAAVPGARLIEFGCAQSVWLSYFARRFGLAIAGIDYSETGCEKAMAVLRRDGTKGEIVHADFMAPPDPLLHAFDVGISFGVAEHFEDTAECLKAFRRFLKPGALLVTLVPNLTGMLGGLQRLLDRGVYDIHVVMDQAALADAHRRAGLDPIDARYLVCSNFGVITIDPSSRARLKRGLRLTLMGLSAGLWVIDRHIASVVETRTLSPYVICTARNPS
jgi:SAM-dependent methyltransferase